MPASKTGSVIQSSASNTAGSTTNSSAVVLTTAYGAAITAQITNGATGPTAACAAILQVSEDGGTNWREWARGVAGTANSGAYTFSFDVPPAVLRCRVQFTGNTGQTVTVAAQAHVLDTI